MWWLRSGSATSCAPEPALCRTPLHLVPLPGLTWGPTLRASNIIAVGAAATDRRSSMRVMVSAAHRTMCCSCAVIAAAMSRIAPACCAFSPATLNACCAARASTLCAPLVTGIMCTWRKGGRDKDAISFVARGHTAHIYTSGLGKKAQSSTFQQSSVPIPPPLLCWPALARRTPGAPLITCCAPAAPAAPQPSTTAVECCTELITPWISATVPWICCRTQSGAGGSSCNVSRPFKFRWKRVWGP